MRIKVKKKIKWRWNIFSLMCTIMMDRRVWKKSVHILSQKTSKKSNNFKLNFMSCWASSFLSNACNNPQTSQTEMDHQWLYSLELTEWKMEHTKQSLPIRIKWSKWPRECLQHLLSSGKRRNVFIDHIEWCKCARNTSKWDYIKATSAKNQFDALVFLEDGFKGDSMHTRQHVHLSQPI